MGKIYARFVLWLIRSAINMLSPLPRQVVEFRDAAVVSRGDLLILSVEKALIKDQRDAMRAALDGVADGVGVKILILEPGMKLAQLIKLHDKG